MVPAVAGAAAWEPVGFGVSGGSAWVKGIAIDGDGAVVATGAFDDLCTGPWNVQGTPACPNPGSAAATGVARWTGAQGSPMGTGLGGSDPYGYVIEVGPDGRTYAGGGFGDAGPGTTNFLAAWGGSGWSSMGTGFGFSTPPPDPGVLEMAFDRSGNLFVGGIFESVNGVNARNIARWNGASWSPLGVGLDTRAEALATAPDGTVYASGNLTIVGVHKNIVQWDGSTWSSVGGQTFGSLWADALAVDRQGVLYAGGQFSTPANGIARWDGNAWSALGSGLSAQAVVGTVATDHDGGVYVGGTALLPASGAPNVSQVAKWDGTTWTLLASALTDGPASSAVSDLAVDPAGYLYAAGGFLVVDGQVTGQIVRTLIATPPVAPTGVAATAGDTLAEVSWTAPTRNGAGTITRYTVTSEPGGNSCTWTTGPLRCTVTGLRKGTRYTFTVRAANIAGEGAAATAVATTSAEATPDTPSVGTPRISRLIPAKGPTRGGNRVQLRGSNLEGVTRVTFGGVRARIVLRQGNRLVVVAPPRARGAVGVTAIAGTARATKRAAYRYVAAPRRVPVVG